VTTAKNVVAFGPMIGLTWGEGYEAQRMWVQRADLEYLRSHLLPVAPPPLANVVGSCWVWVGPLSTDGRPLMQGEGPDGRQTKSVRRMLYDLVYGPLAARTFLAPGCAVGRCCNPHHCVTEERGPVRGQSVPLQARQKAGYDRCKYGHPLTPDNSYVYNGRKLCRTCRAKAQARYRTPPSPRRPGRNPSSG
jgi:hypothetical protein